MQAPRATLCFAWKIRRSNFEHCKSALGKVLISNRNVELFHIVIHNFDNARPAQRGQALELPLPNRSTGATDGT
jgi:hypothetical protein